MSDDIHDAAQRIPLGDMLGLKWGDDYSWEGLFGTMTQRLRERDEAMALLKRATPKHYAAECGHCGIDELPQAECQTVKFIAEINALLAKARESQP